MSSMKTVTINLGDMQQRFETRLASGCYGSADHLMQEALRALDREESETDFDDDFLRRAVEESLADPRPDIPAEDVFARLERMYREDTKAKRDV